MESVSREVHLRIEDPWSLLNACDLYPLAKKEKMLHGGCLYPLKKSRGRGLPPTLLLPTAYHRVLPCVVYTENITEYLFTYNMT